MITNHRQAKSNSTVALLVGLLALAAFAIPTSMTSAVEHAEPAAIDPTLSDMVLAFDGPMEQPPDASMGGSQGPRGQNPPNMERQRRPLEQLRLLKLLEVLDLTSSQEDPFLLAFRAMRKTQRDLDEQRGKLMVHLSDLVQTSPKDDKKINALVDSVVALGDQKRVEARAFLTKVRGFLTSEQIGKMVLFEERFEYELLERVREFRRMGRMGAPERDPMDSN